MDAPLRRGALAAELVVGPPDQHATPPKRTKNAMSAPARACDRLATCQFAFSWRSCPDTSCMLGKRAAGDSAVSRVSS